MSHNDTPVRIVTVGMGGYGQYLYFNLKKDVDPGSYRIVAGVDPFAKNSGQYQEYVEAGIPIFDDLDEAFAELPEEDKPELAIIASPIQYHDAQTRVALKNNCLVLCEKPLTARWEESQALAELASETGTRLAVGFQWSYYPSILKIKAEILGGTFGKVHEAKAIVVWPRYSDYYVGWKGQLRSPTGEWILDSVVSNATAHYLHNMLFLMGDSLDEAALPVTAKAMTYRANPIPSFDTISLSGEFSNGAKLLYMATHAAEDSIDPIFEIRCDNAVITCDMNEDGAVYKAIFNDGQTKVYGRATNDHDSAEKMRVCIKAVREPETVIPCQAHTVLPHLKLCNAIFPVRSSHRARIQTDQATL